MKMHDKEYYLRTLGWYAMKHRHMRDRRLQVLLHLFAMLLAAYAYVAWVTS